MIKVLYIGPKEALGLIYMRSYIVVADDADDDHHHRRHVEPPTSYLARGGRGGTAIFRAFALLAMMNER